MNMCVTKMEMRGKLKRRWCELFAPFMLHALRQYGWPLHKCLTEASVIDPTAYPYLDNFSMPLMARYPPKS